MDDDPFGGDDDPFGYDDEFDFGEEDRPFKGDDEDRDEDRDDEGDGDLGFDDQDDGGDDIEFVATYEQQSRARAAEFVPREGPGKRALRTPLALALEQVQGVLSGPSYHISQETRKQIVDALEKLGPKLVVSNIATMVAAMTWKVEKKKLDATTFQKFATSHNFTTPLQQADLLRYIRSLA